MTVRYLSNVSTCNGVIASPSTSAVGLRCPAKIAEADRLNRPRFAERGYLFSEVFDLKPTSQTTGRIRFFCPLNTRLRPATARRARKDAKIQRTIAA
jgi:hypothetical protein